MRGRASHSWAGCPDVYMDPAFCSPRVWRRCWRESGLMSGKETVICKLERKGWKFGTDGVAFALVKEIQEFCWEWKDLLENQGSEKQFGVICFCFLFFFTLPYAHLFEILEQAKLTRDEGRG